MEELIGRDRGKSVITIGGGFMSFHISSSLFLFLDSSFNY
jgi:hypothetical protein